MQWTNFYNNLPPEDCQKLTHGMVQDKGGAVLSFGMATLRIFKSQFVGNIAQVGMCFGVRLCYLRFGATLGLRCLGLYLGATLGLLERYACCLRTYMHA